MFTHRLAIDFRSAAAAYFDVMSPEQSDADADAKARRVYGWIRDALVCRGQGWQRAFIHPASFAAYKAAIELFPALYERHASTRFAPGSGPPATAAMLALRTTADVLKDRMPTYTLAQGNDPYVLSEILAVRNRRKSELAVFRTRIVEEAEKLRGAELSPHTLMDRVTSFDNQIRPVIAEQPVPWTTSGECPSLCFGRQVQRSASALL